AITPSTSWRFKARVKRRMTSRGGRGAASGMTVPPPGLWQILGTNSPAVAAAPQNPKDASPVTPPPHPPAVDALPFADPRDFDDARRGFVGSLPEVEIKNDAGRVVWTLRDYAFLADAEAPPTVNPSLWRQARLNLGHGLFQVTDRIYQVRGFDISNMTLIQGDRGLVVIDPLISTEGARAG